MPGLTNRRLRDGLSTLAIPCLALWGIFLGHNVLTFFSPDQAFSEYTIVQTLHIVCWAVLLWWLVSVCYLFALSLKAKNSGLHPAVPSWIPRFLRNTVFAVVGLGALTSNAYAAPAPTAVIQVNESVTPFFATHTEEKKHSPDDLPENQSISLVVSQNKEPHVPLTPFFQVPSSNQEDQVHVHETAEASSATSNKHVVVAGETLWSIAAGLNPSSTDAEILQRVHHIYDLNRSTLSSPDDLIYPGQVLETPAP